MWNGSKVVINCNQKEDWRTGEGAFCRVKIIYALTWCNSLSWCSVNHMSIWINSHILPRMELLQMCVWFSDFWGDLFMQSIACLMVDNFLSKFLVFCQKGSIFSRFLPPPTVFVLPYILVPFSCTATMNIVIWFVCFPSWAVHNISTNIHGRCLMFSAIKVDCCCKFNWFQLLSLSPPHLSHSLFHTHTHTHACMYIFTHTHTHTPLMSNADFTNWLTLFSCKIWSKYVWWPWL